MRYRAALIYAVGDKGTTITKFYRWRWQAVNQFYKWKAEHEKDQPNIMVCRMLKGVREHTILSFHTITTEEGTKTFLKEGDNIHEMHGNT